ncbi:MAG: hypothetical protein P1S60_12800 [Anaerolineae bacterium]|nr:hypothetical protein [Anaerolineae bacterium]
MTKQHEDIQHNDSWNIGMLLIAGLALIILMLPPVKSWLNSIPNLWKGLYPLLTVFAVYILYNVIVKKEGTLNTIKWSGFLLSAAAMTIAVYGLGPVFFVVGRISAYFFIVIELGSIIIGITRKRMDDVQV